MRGIGEHVRRYAHALRFAIDLHGVSEFHPIVRYKHLVSEPNPLRPLRDLQYGLGETVFGGCRHLENMNIWGFNEPK